MGGREGRCLSVCVQSVIKDLSSLPQDVCEQDERCAPCYDPRTGMGTGACTIGVCDAGPTEPPKLFEACGPGGSSTHFCVPSGTVPIGERCNFDNKGCNATPCKTAGTLCVPKKIVTAGPAFEPKKCTNDLTGFLALFSVHGTDAHCYSLDRGSKLEQGVELRAQLGVVLSQDADGGA